MTATAARKIARIWTQPGCADCGRVQQILLDQGYDLTILDAATIMTDGSRDEIEAVVQLHMQDTRLPIVERDGKFVDPRDIK